MITAEEARQLSGPDAEDYLDFLENEIRKAAKEKKKKITVRDNPYASWLYNRKTIAPAAEKALKRLETNGFKLYFYYDEGSQFVDMGLVISWERLK